MAEPRSQANEQTDLAPPVASMSSAEYEAWKTAKIIKALEQSRDRDVMVAADEVWERFGFER